jgi:hypothetical protein
MKLNVLRLCSHSKWIFIYWLENIYNGNLSKQQIECLNGIKINCSGWLISTSGYYDKSIEGNWKGDENFGQPPPGKKIDRQLVLKSKIFKNFQKSLYDIVINRKNDLISCAFLTNDILYNELDYELRLFREHIFPSSMLNYMNLREQFVFLNYSSNDTFNLCNNKHVVIINQYADVLRDHYKSGKVVEWYTKYAEYNNCIIPSISNISSIEIPYPFGNGMNEPERNNFFETLEYIKQKIDSHKEYYDIALISAGIYSAFIADYISNTKNKDFIAYGRELNNVFCIKYKYTYEWVNCNFLKENFEPYLCIIPDKYKLNGCNFVESGCYW